MKMTANEPITNDQIIAIRTAMHRQFLTPYKEEIIESFTGGRTGSTKGMYKHEAYELLQFLNHNQMVADDTDKMIKKIFAMAFELGWIKKETIIGHGGNIVKRKIYKPLHDWVEKFGYLKKPLRKYEHNELPKLVWQFESGPYAEYMVNQPGKIAK